MYSGVVNLGHQGAILVGEGINQLKQLHTAVPASSATAVYLGLEAFLGTQYKVQELDALPGVVEGCVCRWKRTKELIHRFHPPRFFWTMRVGKPHRNDLPAGMQDCFDMPVQRIHLLRVARVVCRETLCKRLEHGTVGSRRMAGRPVQHPVD